jgi:hypothetical protein
MSGVKGVGGKGGSDPSKAAKEKGKTGAFQAVQSKSTPDKAQTGSDAKTASVGSSGGTSSGIRAKQGPASGAFKVSNAEPLRPSEDVKGASTVRPEIAQFAQGMVHAADAAAMPGPTTDGDLLPRESVSGLFVRDFALQGAVALGRPPLGEDEAARIVIEKHIAGTPGLYYDAAVEADGQDAFIVKLHRLDTNPPFLPDPEAEATYRIDRRSWNIEEQ